MNTWGLALVIGSLAATAFAFIWVAIKLGSPSSAAPKNKVKDGREAITQGVEEDAENIFNDDFREELRNKGRLHFEKIIGENAAFLQQDLRLTTSQINEFMKQEITKTLQEEFAKYEQAIEESKQIALASIQKSQEGLEEERKALHDKFAAEATAQRDVIIKRFELNMGEIVNHYILDAIGNEIDLSSQLTYILEELQSNKETIVEDIRSGA